MRRPNYPTANTGGDSPSNNTASSTGYSNNTEGNDEQQFAGDRSDTGNEDMRRSNSPTDNTAADCSSNNTASSTGYSNNTEGNDEQQYPADMSEEGNDEQQYPADMSDTDYEDMRTSNNPEKVFTAHSTDNTARDCPSNNTASSSQYSNNTGGNDANQSAPNMSDTENKGIDLINVAAVVTGITGINVHQRMVTTVDNHVHTGNETSVKNAMDTIEGTKVHNVGNGETSAHSNMADMHGHPDTQVESDVQQGIDGDHNYSKTGDQREQNIIIIWDETHHLAAPSAISYPNVGVQIASPLVLEGKK